MSGLKACPYTPEELREMYWTEGLSLRRISLKIQSVTGTYCDAYSVLRWFRAAGIPTRDKSQAGKTAYKSIGGLKQAKTAQLTTQVAQIAASRHQSGFTPPVKCTEALVRKRQQQALEQRGQRPIKPCANGCGNNVQRPPHEMTSELVFCSVSCAVKYRHRIAKEVKDNDNNPMQEA